MLENTQYLNPKKHEEQVMDKFMQSPERAQYICTEKWIFVCSTRSFNVFTWSAEKIEAHILSDQSQATTTEFRYSLSEKSKRNWKNTKMFNNI